MRSKFYQKDKLIFESSLYSIFLKQILNVQFQSLPDSVILEGKKGWYYELYYDDVVLSMNVKLFHRPAYRLLMNGEDVGSIGNPHIIAVEHRYYEMNSDIDDEKIDLYFLLLFLTQLRGF